MQQPIFQKRLFWDVKFDSIDYEKSAGFVIERVFQRGDVEDIRQCRRYYGDSRIRTILVESKWLPKETVYLAAAILGNALTDYKCYNTALLNPQHWLY